MQSLKSFCSDNNVTALSNVKLSKEKRPYLSMVINGEVQNVWFSKNLAAKLKLHDGFDTFKKCVIGLVKNAAGEERLRLGSPAENMTDLSTVNWD